VGRRIAFDLPPQIVKAVISTDFLDAWERYFFARRREFHFRAICRWQGIHRLHARSEWSRKKQNEEEEGG
jgi:hypothetical protein